MGTKPTLWPEGNEVSWQDIVDLRGGVTPTKCDFCGAECGPEHLEPEEAGAWACFSCIVRWELEEKELV